MQTTGEGIQIKDEHAKQIEVHSMYVHSGAIAYRSVCTAQY